jgi:hypothetical protein
LNENAISHKQDHRYEGICLMRKFETRTLPKNPDTLAPDGAKVRLLGALEGGSFAISNFPPAQYRTR